MQSITPVSDFYIFDHDRVAAIGAKPRIDCDLSDWHAYCIKCDNPFESRIERVAIVQYQSSGEPVLKKLFISAALAAAFMSTVASAAANLVTNGGFETTTLTGKGYFLNNVTGWSGGGSGTNGDYTFLDFPGTATSGAGGYAVYGPFADSPAGGNFVQADGASNYRAAISQTITGLKVGQEYSLTFYQAAGQQSGFTGNTTERWSVTFGGTTQLSDIYMLSTPQVGPWEAQTMNFTATSASQILSFLAIGTPTGLPPTSFLDGVSLLAVPEPATWGMMIVGLGAMGAAARLRRRRTIAAA